MSWYNEFERVSKDEWRELLRLIEDSKSVEELRSRVIYQDIKRRFWI